MLVLVAAEIVQPRDFIKHGDNEAQALFLFELLPDILDLVLKALARVFYGLDNDLLARARWPLVCPYQIDQVLIDGLVLAAFLLDFVGEPACIGRGNHTRVNTDNLASIDLLGGPFLDCGNILQTLFEQLPVGIELL